VNRVRGEIFNGFKLIELLRNHVPQDFNPDDFVIAGSARLWVGGVTRHLSDLDLLARPGSDTWRRAKELAFIHAPVFLDEPLRVSDYSGDKIARLYAGVVEVCDKWVLPGSDTHELIDHADVFDGFRYLTVADVVAYKRYLNRPKDHADLRVLAGFGYGTGFEPVRR
jgi:hypothetical protein